MGVKSGWLIEGSDAAEGRKDGREKMSEKKEMNEPHEGQSVKERRHT